MKISFVAQQRALSGLGTSVSTAGRSDIFRSREWATSGLKIKGL